MKIVKLYGGLGNQMFQHAFARALEAASADEVRFDASVADTDAAHNGLELDRVFGLVLPAATRQDCMRLSVPANGLLNRLRRKYLTKPTHCIDRRFGYQPELLTLPGDRYFEGYWQTERYFAHLERELRAAYAFRHPLSPRNRTMLDSLDRPIASIHVRRGDYLDHDNLNICTPAYYERAVASLGSGIRSLLVFSDDMGYCKEALRLGCTPAVYVDWNRGLDSWQDMALMSACDHHVVANSSFSWWGAWLDANPRKRVIAPAIWNRRQIIDHDHYYSFTFDDVVPEGWERVQP